MSLTRIGVRGGLVVWGCDCGRSFITQANQNLPAWCAYCRGASGPVQMGCPPCSRGNHELCHVEGCACRVIHSGHADRAALLRLKGGAA